MGVQGNAPAVTALPQVMHKCAFADSLGMSRQNPGRHHYRLLQNLCDHQSLTIIIERPMPRKSTADRLKTLREKREQLDAQLRALEARNKQAERKADTRRKVIAGALALEHYEKNPESEFHRILFRLLDEYVMRPHDRALFPELSEADAPAAQPGLNTGSEFIPAGHETESPSPAL